MSFLVMGDGVYDRSFLRTALERILHMAPVASSFVPFIRGGPDVRPRTSYIEVKYAKTASLLVSYEFG